MINPNGARAAKGSSPIWAAKTSWPSPTSSRWITTPLSKVSPTILFNGVAHVETHNYENFLPTILSSGRYATEIGCKSKTQESIVDALDYDGYGPVGTCKEVHLSIYDWVLRNVAPRTRQRFLTREKQLQFSDDAVSATGAQ